MDACEVPVAAMDDRTAPQSIVLLEQNFAKLEEAIEGGVWEIDGDDLSLYACDGASDDGPAGAVFVAEGDCGAQAELVHALCNGEGARVTHLTAKLICESLDADSAGCFTVGLAFDDDFEEAALLAVTLRRLRSDPDEEESINETTKPVALLLNGNVATDDIGQLPVHVELDVALHWDEGARRIVLHHHVCPATLGVTGSPDTVVDTSTNPSRQFSTGFYTTGVKFDSAKALCLRATGTVKIRLLHIQCNTSDTVAGTTET